MSSCLSPISLNIRSVMKGTGWLGKYALKLKLSPYCFRFWSILIGRRSKGSLDWRDFLYDGARGSISRPHLATKNNTYANGTIKFNFSFNEAAIPTSPSGTPRSHDIRNATGKSAPFYKFFRGQSQRYFAIVYKFYFCMYRSPLKHYMVDYRK